MEKILIQLKKNIIYFKRKSLVKSDERKLINTNIISDNELIFSEEYIKKNLKIVTIFLKDLMIEQNVDTACIYKNSVIYEILNICKVTSSINNIVFKEEMNITYDNCSSIIKSENIKNVSFYSLHDFLTEYLDSNGIFVEVRKEIMFASDFANSNNINKYSSLIYKRVINLAIPLKENDVEEFKIFINTNKYLRIIHMNKCDLSSIDFVLKTLKNNNKENIKIILHDNITDEKTAKYIKKVKKNLKKSNNIQISVAYTNSYLKKNMIPQTNLTILKTCFLLILFFCTSIFGYYFINNHRYYKEDTELKTELIKYISTTDTTEIIKEIEEETEKVVINEEIASLITLNEDVTGWLNVPGTAIDYPVLLGEDNLYYLKHTVKNTSSDYGSIFMNYTNNGDYSDDNTVMFGHNFTGTSVMFSDLNLISTDNWLSNTDNYTITIDTLYENLEYEIFSFYIIDITTDYLQTNFANVLDRNNFYIMLTERSEYDFGIEVDEKDKIITLSTCSNNGTKRFVVHAVLKTS